VTLATTAALLGFTIALTTWGAWFRRIHAVALPADRTPFVVAAGAAATLGMTAFVLGVGWIAGLLAGVAVVVGTAFAILVAISAQKGGTGAFVVGRPVPEFGARDDAGNPFSISSAAGKPLLLKFFRGHW
jgi:hypothetical protein